MMRLAREFRLLPVVLFAAICLFTLKIIGIARDGGYTLAQPSEPAPARPYAPAAASLGEAITKTILAERQPSWAREMFNYPDATATARDKPITVAGKKDILGDITGSVGESKPADKPPGNKKPGPAGAVDPPKDPGGTVVSMDPNRPASAAERAILERLQERRQEIEAQAREMDIRDGLMKAAEKQLEARVAELKEMEARVNTAVQNKESAEANRFKGLVSMYENMKAKDAAKIFDRLDLAILVQVTSQINPRRMSDILGQMSPEAAERLTVELANRAMGTERPANTAELPKIQGKPGP